LRAQSASERVPDGLDGRSGRRGRSREPHPGRGQAPSQRRFRGLKDRSLEESDDLPEPDVLAQEIADDLQTALEQFQAIAEKLKG
jgi:hypothetical protein